MIKDPQPLEIIRDVYNTRINLLYSKKAYENPRIQWRRLRFLNIISSILKPIIRHTSLFPENMRWSLEVLIGKSMKPDIIWSLLPIARALDRYAQAVFDAADNKTKPLVWVEWCLNPDIVYAFDAQPICTEGLSSILYFKGLDLNEYIIDYGEQRGVPSEYCSAGKSAVGACLSKQLPWPDCIMTTSHPCDTMLSSYQSMQYVTKAPMYVLDTPYWDDERALDYYTKEMWGLIEFFEKHLKRKLDFDRLRQVLEESNCTNELLMEINEMHRATPCPGSIMSNIFAWSGRIIGMGTSDITESTRRLYDITKKRFDQGKGVIKKENIRVIWFDVTVAFYPIVLWMEEKFGAVTLVDLLSYINSPPIDTSTEESMVRGMALANMNLTMARQFRGPIDYFHRDLSRICDEYNGDCVIIAGHVGCKHGWASVRILKNEMKKRGIPLLVLTTDVFDQRITHEQQLKDQIEDFFINNGLV